MTKLIKDPSLKLINLYSKYDKSTTILSKGNKLFMKGKINSLLNLNYFSAKFSFTVINNSIINIKIYDIEYKNKQNVSLSDQTNEYHYLYNISSSSCSSSSSSSSSCSSSSSSILSIKNKNIEKNIYNEVKNVISKIKFTEKTIKTVLITLPDSPILINYKFIAKYTNNCPKSSSNSSSISSSKSNSKFVIIKKIICIASIIIFIGVLLSKNNFIKNTLARLFNNDYNQNKVDYDVEKKDYIEPKIDYNDEKNYIEPKIDYNDEKNYIEPKIDYDVKKDYIE